MPMFRPSRELILSNTSGFMCACEVADIGEPHGLVAKYACGTVHGGWPAYTWVKLDPRSHTMTHGLNIRTPDDIARFVAACEIAQHAHGNILRCPTTGQVEAAKRDHPWLVAKLAGAGLLRSADADGWRIPERLGKLWRAKLKSGRPGEPIDIGLDEMLPPLERFLEDDMGDYGLLSREPIEDAKTLWSLDLVADRPMRNRDAITTGDGLVVGRYPLEGDRFFWVLQRLQHRGSPQTLIGCWPASVTMAPLAC